MKLTNIKIKVETDEENQYILKQHIKLNEGCAWAVYLAYGNANWYAQGYDSTRAVCSVWKGFRHLIITVKGDLILFTVEEHYDKRTEKEITFAEFKAMCEPKKTLWDKRLSDADNPRIYLNDIKEALKEFIDWCETRALEVQKGRHNYGYRGKAKEIFGDELL